MKINIRERLIFSNVKSAFPYSNSRINSEKKKYFIQYFLTLSAFKE